MTQVREEFTTPAPEETILRVAERIREWNIPSYSRESLFIPDYATALRVDHFALDRSF